ncbi:LacI family DNA-binding transcriptional regulator [Arcanobacterium phocae]|uniref:LacI family DNA-binding transcriptional regulator n=1 Tax=Arcanobacterium phocae TaxID=131112 RepID=UPI001C0F30B7|nr:LacI family DNA-binding transcriptional regulator [Arcanobacterium phocae]
MQKRKVTMKDVASKAGVSRASVSVAFNNPGKLASETVDRIFQAASELGYVVDPVARTMRTRTTSAIGLLIPQTIEETIQNPYYPRLIEGIGQVCLREGYNLLLVPPLRGSMLHAIPTAAVDGFLISGLEDNRSEVLDILGDHLPAIVIDPSERHDISTVGIDDSEDFYDLVMHLLALGHERIAFAAIYTDTSERVTGWKGTMRRRVEGAMRALAKHGLSIESPNIILCEVPSTYRGGEEAFRILWGSERRPTAIVAFSDVIALGIMHAARNAKVNIPTDLSVTGYDDLPGTELVNPGLTTIRQPIVAKGRIAAEMLVERIKSTVPSLVEHKKLQTTLIVRGTTAPPNNQKK